MGTPSTSAADPRSPHLNPNHIQEAMAPNRSIPAWLLSLVLHATLLFVIGYSLRILPRGTRVEPDRTAGIVLVKQDEGRRNYLDQPQESVDFESTDPSLPSLEESLPSADELPIDVSDVLPSDSELVGLGSSLPAAGELTRSGGGGSPRKLGGKVTTEVFGVQGEGTRFIYVFDRSGSMDGFGGRPLMAAKAELLASLNDLDRVHQFQIIFYNEEPSIFHAERGAPQLVWGDEAGKSKARRFVERVLADGGTRHMDALRLALGLSPDVVFFLTDADEPKLSDSELSTIRRLNHGAMINTVEFGFGPRRDRDNFLMRLARENRGRHAYVDVSQLRFQ